MKTGKKWVITACIAAAVICIGSLFVFGKKKVSFSLGYETDEEISTQKVKRGEYACEPEYPVRLGYIFLGWYEEDSPARQYDFFTPVNKSVTLTAKWYDPSDITDTDGDGLTDALETVILTDINLEDTDGDGLSDKVEFTEIGTNPLLSDTDGNGIIDSCEDADGDLLTNAEELSLGTSLIFSDTDGDMLSDYDEVNIYGTLPLTQDSDSDLVSDYTEILIGTDPLSVNYTFTTKAEGESVSESNPVSLSVSAVTDSSGAGSLQVSEIGNTHIPALSSGAVGYMGGAYELTTSGTLMSAELTFTYDVSQFSDDCNPCIYYYDLDKGLTEIESSVVENGVVMGTTTHFSIYTLLDKNLIDQALCIIDDAIEEINRDDNGDKIPDRLAELINSGDILYDSTYLLYGILDEMGRDCTDWDDDGIPNGDEIEVVCENNVYVIKINSNPILPDSDFDGISDYDELTKTGTSPLRYDHTSVSALQCLENNGQYLYAIQKGDWGDTYAAAVAHVFGYSGIEETKRCLVNYIYDYAPDDTLEKCAQQISEYEERVIALNYLNVMGNCIKVVDSATSIMDTVSGKKAEKEKKCWKRKPALQTNL